jgi:hypothetical protein
VLHGLLAGRLAKPYVDWSYGACLAAAGLALTMRFVATVRSRDTAAQPVPERAASALYAAPAVLDRLTGWPAPPGSIAGPAVSRAAAAGLTGPPRRPPARALPPGRADRPVTAGEWPTWPQPADWPPPQEWHTGPQPAAERPTGPQAAAGRQTGPQAAADRRAGPHPAQRPDGRPQETERPGPGEPAGGAWR